MTSAAVASFMTGFFLFFPIPFFVRRFGKFMPADAGTALVRSFHLSRFARPRDEKRKALRRRLWRKLFVAGLFQAMTGGVLSLAVLYSGYPCFLLLFLFAAFLLAATDERYHLLPDFLTVPLMIAGFFAAAADLAILSAPDSAAGAVFGFLLPTVCGAMMTPFKGRAMGGGDFKMLAATGAWIGVPGLVSAIVASCFFFAAFMLTRKKTSGPYGLSLVLGALTYLVLIKLGLFVV